MQIPQFLKIKSAAPKRNKFSLHQQMITTSDFGQLKPVICRELLPGDKVNINGSCFVRTDALPVPTYGNIHINNRCYYVHMSDVWLPWTKFKLGQKYYWGSQTKLFTSVPNVTNNALVRIFIDSIDDTRYNLPLLEEGSSSNYDFQVDNLFYTLTRHGRKAYDLLNSLGYSLNWTGSDTTPLSLMPLLAYNKVYFDYFIPSRYQVDSIFNSIFNCIDWDELVEETFYSYVYNLIMPKYGNFDLDYFTSAWVTPNGPSSAQLGNRPSFLLSAENGTTIYSVNTSSGNSLADGAKINREYAGSSFNQYGLDLLKSLNNLFNRKKIAGTRYIDDILSQFGFKSNSHHDRFSIFIGQDKQPVQIQDVVATSNTQVGGDISYLGQYGGKGISYGKGNFEFESDDFGYIFLISEISTESKYYQGRKREILHTGLYDFYTPEFDNVGIRAIRNDELFADYNTDGRYTAGQSYGGKPNGVFGFCPNYTEYKIANNTLSGDFRIPSKKRNLESWHLFRQFADPTSLQPLSLTRSFMGLNPNINGNDFDRIFYFDSDEFDHYYLIYDYDITKYSKMIPITESVNTYGHGDEVTVHNQGSLQS